MPGQPKAALRRSVKDFIRSLEAGPLREHGTKWVPDGLNSSRLASVANHEANGLILFNEFEHALPSMPEFQALKSEWDQDPILSNAPRESGFPGETNHLLRTVVTHATRVRGSRLRLYPDRAWKTLLRLRSELSSPEAQFDWHARLIGCEVATKLQIGDSQLVPLSETQLLARQPFMSPVSSSFHEAQLLQHRTEIRTTAKYGPAATTTAWRLEAFSESQANASESLRESLALLRLVHEGRLGVQLLRCSSLLFPFCSFGSVRIDRFSQSTQLSTVHRKSLLRLAKSRHAWDKVLARSVARFQLACERSTQDDTIVDYVVAWESLLLTAVGSPQRSEQGYRFSINGAALMHQASSEGLPRVGTRRKFEAAYDVRSIVVHGGDLSESTKALQKAGFQDLETLVTWLGDSYRSAVQWLSQTAKDDRPYLARDGWQHLLFLEGGK